MLSNSCLTGARKDRSFLEGNSIRLFRAGIKSKATKDPYERRLMGYLQSINLKPDDFVLEAKANPAKMELRLIDFIEQQKERAEKGEISNGTISNVLKAVRLLLDMNDANLNWKKIKRTMPKIRRYALDRVPTLQEIRKILDNSDLRGRALTYVMLTGGVREGAVSYFKVGDYKKLDGCGRLVVYSGDPEQYITFITKEACKAIDEYLAYRQNYGEELTKKSPLFRDKFDPVKGKWVNGKRDVNDKVISMTPPAVRLYYNRLLFAIGIREERKRRHEFSVHSFRKWFKTNAERGGMKPIDVETLMGHSTGISDSYYRPTENDLMGSYLSVCEALAISEVEEVKRELAVVEKSNAERLANIEAQLSALSRMTDGASQRLDQSHR